MFQKIPQENLYTSDHGWLQSKFLFSFAEYYDPNNLEWGSLRVFNDDTLAPKTGFPMHSHKEMEIITVMLEGQLTHKDSMGNVRSISGGDIQYMSAGTGVTHSEMNDNDSPVSLFQLWFYPTKSRLTPTYREDSFAYLEEYGLHLLVSPTGENGSLKADTQAKVFYGNLIAGGVHTRTLLENEFTLIYLRKGEMQLGDITLVQGDQLRITHEKLLTIKIIRDAEFLMVISQ